MDDKNQDHSATDTYDDRLKGTFITVILIGIFIILSWLGIFYFYVTTF